METEPALLLRGLSIWVEGPEHPDATDYWDGDWLVVRVRMEAPGAVVDCRRASLMITDFKRFREQLVSLREALAGEAALSGLEGNLKVTLKAGRLGHVEGEVEITPDLLNQSHNFTLDLDQSYLPAVIASCDAIIDRFPAVGAPER